VFLSRKRACSSEEITPAMTRADESEERENRDGSPPIPISAWKCSYSVRQQQGPRDNARRATRAMPPRESWLGERDENSPGRRILRHFAMRRDRWKEGAGRTSGEKGPKTSGRGHKEKRGEEQKPREGERERERERERENGRFERRHARVGWRCVHA